MEAFAIVNQYFGRVMVYFISAVAGSMAGAMLTWTSANWVDANPLTAGPAVAFLSLGPAITIAAVAPVRKSAAVLIALCAAAAMVAMWWLFAFNESSTSVFVFFLGWFIGIPTAGALVIASQRFGRRPDRDHGRRPVRDRRADAGEVAVHQRVPLAPRL